MGVAGPAGRKCGRPMWPAKCGRPVGYAKALAVAHSCTAQTLRHVACAGSPPAHHPPAVPNASPSSTLPRAAAMRKAPGPCRPELRRMLAAEDAGSEAQVPSSWGFQRV
jgi:hypothetical protein